MRFKKFPILSGQGRPWSLYRDIMGTDEQERQERINELLSLARGVAEKADREAQEYAEAKARFQDEIRELNRLAAEREAQGRDS